MTDYVHSSEEIKFIRAPEGIGIASYPTVIGYDGKKIRSELDQISIEDSIRRHLNYHTLPEYLTLIRKKRSLIKNLRERLFERGAVYFFTGKNTNVDAGLNFIAKLMTNKATVGWTHMNVGTDGTATSSGMTDLVTPLTPRFPLSARFDSYNFAYHTCFYNTADGNGGGTAIWLEVAPFTALTSGTMLGRFVIPAFTKNNTKSAQVIYSTALIAVPQ